jgi:hypothetical protein
MLGFQRALMGLRTKRIQASLIKIHITTRGKISFLPLFLVLLLGIIDFSFAGESGEIYKTTDGRIIILRTGITLTDGAGNRIDSFQSNGWEIKGACVDPKQEFLFAIIGNRGAIRGERMAMFGIGNGRIRKVWVGANRGHHPWKILMKDVDGDSKLDLCVGVWKKARFHPVFDNRLFIYNWEGQQLSPKWLGSRLSSPFLDFDFQDIDNDGVEELLALELQRNGLRRIMSYKWKGFGFEGFKVLRAGLTIENLGTLKLTESGGIK